jgi:hypothetical protein
MAETGGDHVIHVQVPATQLRDRSQPPENLK